MPTRIDFTSPPLEVARALVGVVLWVGEVAGRIVETEAYDADDPASHSHNGRTPRNASMFGPPGRVYVYRSYGLHWCLNFVCREEGHGAAVLIRALEPVAGVNVMRTRRGVADEHLLCAGPGRVAQALGISRQHDGQPVDEEPFRLETPTDCGQIVCGNRVGITKAADLPWRFGLAGSRYLSRPFR